MGDVDVGQTVLKNWIKEIDKTFKEISYLNLSEITGNKTNKILDLRTEKVISLQGNPIYHLQVDQAGYEPRIRKIVNVQKNAEAKESQPLQICTNNAVSLMPIWDEEFIYCAGNLFEGTFSDRDHSIASRDYAVYSYPWSNLIATEHLNLIDEQNNEMLLPNLGEFVEIFMFGLTKDSGRTTKKHITIKELSKILRNKSLYEYCMREEIEYIAYKGLKFKDHNGTNNTYTSRDTEHEKQKTFIIFVDSLDKNVIQSPEILSRFPNLEKIASKSILFKNYTSSGFWTFPCLHSIHHGIAPYATGSFCKYISANNV